MRPSADKYTRVYKPSEILNNKIWYFYEEEQSAIFMSGIGPPKWYPKTEYYVPNWTLTRIAKLFYGHGIHRD